MSNYYNLSQIPVIDFHLSTTLNAEIEMRINSLKLSDLNSDEAFSNTLNRLQGIIDLKPVTFSDPEITDHRTVEKNIPAGYHSPFPSKRQVYVISVRIEFTGSQKLFNYKPNGMSVVSNEVPVIHKPTGNAVHLEVEHSTLSDKDGILKEVQRQMSCTYTAIRGNNKYISGWGDSMKSSIETKLVKHRNDLQKLYGK